ncbi:MAG TPA: sigma-54-dependent Fis family transcriptional regulator, partial [Sneathiellales bacterium]|nr:sigma-54-dependent Fis family transcriptional regulator [Sneathiellales bacterium]
GYFVRTAVNSDEALSEIGQRRPSLLILDIWMHDSQYDGLELLDIVLRDHSELPVLMISGHGNIETAVAAIKRGAYDFIEKPFKTDRLLVLIERAIEAAQLKRENRELRRRTGEAGELIGESSAITMVRNTIDKVATTGSRVMISGPPGSGKELVARLIHRQSRRAEGPFVVLNAANMAPDRIEVELFGAERGVSGRKVGVFEQAHNGTLFIDHVSDMPLETQAKILRVLVDQTFVRIGGNTRVEVDVRVVSATNQDLARLITEGKFREDLYHRLAVVPVVVPPLIERRDDIPNLVRHSVERLAAANGLPARPIGEDAIAAMQAYDWPGNVRQLKNFVERMLILSSGDGDGPIGADKLPSEISRSPGGRLKNENADEIMGKSLRQAREIFEREYLMAQIKRFGGNISRTANFIGMERSALHRKLKSLNIATRDRAERAVS